jgi:hypothetical protein
VALAQPEAAILGGDGIEVGEMLGVFEGGVDVYGESATARGAAAAVDVDLAAVSGLFGGAGGLDLAKDARRSGQRVKFGRC